jgi:hypothetical protein
VSIFDAPRLAFGDLEPLLDRRQQQDAVARGQPAAVESDMHRFASHRWQTRQNPGTFPIAGVNSVGFGLIRPCNQIMDETNRLCRSRQPLHATW